MFLYNTVLKLDDKLQTPLLTNYKDLLKDKPAVIVSAGPSLAKNIEILKKYKDNVYIFCVGTALKTLLANDIVPDFLHIIEKVNTFLHYNVPQSKDITLICEPYTHFRTFLIPFKRRLITASEETDASRWYLDIRGKDLVKFETKGTVSYHALYSAKYLGCNPIILLGQDLAYPDGKCYAKGSEFEDLECFFDDELQKYRIYPKNFEKYRDAYYASSKLSDEEKTKNLLSTLERYNSELVTVDGQNGDKLPTSNAYALFIEYIKDFGLRFNNEIKLINSSVGGAKIDGFDVKPLETVLKTYAVADLNKEKLLDTTDFSTDDDLEKIIENLRKNIRSIDAILPFYEKGKAYTDSLKKELFNKKKYTPNAAKNMSKAANLYVELTNKYILSDKLLYMTALKEHSEIAYLMKENKVGENLEFDQANAFCEAFCAYFENIPLQLATLKFYINVSLENLERKLDESCNTKGF